MQYQLSEVRSKVDFDIAGPLPQQNIDTGMGLERMAAVLQGVDNLYEIDTSRAILDRAAELTGVRYGADPAADVRLRVVADHARTAVMLIGDGVTPSNEGRGYVLRRIMRRAVRAMRLLGAQEPDDDRAGRRDASARWGRSTPSWSPTRAASTPSPWPRRAPSWRRCAPARRSSTRPCRRPGPPAACCPGERAFQLHDTYGFPIDLTLEMAAEQGLQVDEAGLPLADARAARPRQGRQPRQQDPAAPTPPPSAALLDAAGASTFTGYAEVRTEAVLRGLLVDGELARGRAGGHQRRPSCSTARRSTPRPAASWPTPAAWCWPTAPSSRSPTCRRRCPT